MRKIFIISLPTTTSHDGPLQDLWCFDTILNSMENTYKAIFNKSYRYFLMLESYENTLYATKNNFFLDEYANK